MQFWSLWNQPCLKLCCNVHLIVPPRILSRNTTIFFFLIIQKIHNSCRQVIVKYYNNRWFLLDHIGFSAAVL